MTLTPYVSLSGYALKIIELDGTVSLTLKVNDAKTSGSKKSLAWSVSSQPWHAGDKLPAAEHRDSPLASSLGPRIVDDTWSERFS